MKSLPPPPKQGTSQAWKEAKKLELDHKQAERLQEDQRLADEHASRVVCPDMIDAVDFIAEQHPQPRELVSGMLHRGEKLVLGGGSKSFKTWALLDLALSVSHGEPWLGRKTIHGRVLYINFEIQNYAWQRRIAGVAHAKKIAELKRGTVQLWNLRGHAADFKDLLPRIAEQTRDSGFALIILDPIYKLYGRTDENKAGDVAALLNGIESLAVQTGAAIAFGAHFSKGNQAGKEAIDRISGSGVFARDPDSILIFTRHEAEDAYTVESILRNFAPVKPFAVRWKFPLFELADELDPARLKKAKGRSATFTVPMILRRLGKRGLTFAQWQKLCAADGVTESTFKRLLAQAKKSGDVTKTKDKWFLSKGSKGSKGSNETSEPSNPSQAHKAHTPLGCEPIEPEDKSEG